MQYAKKEELEAIKQHYDHPTIPYIQEKITTGDWDSLFKTLGKESNLSFIFLAAYCQREISLDDLATGLIIHRAYFNSPEPPQILKIDSQLLKKMAPNKKHRTLLKTHLKTLSESQKVCMFVPLEAFDEYTRKVIQSSFKVFPLIPGVLSDEKHWGLVSFGLAKKVYSSLGIELVPMLHAANFSKVAKRLANRRSDFALFLPLEKVFIHGSQDSTFFSPIHDLFHAAARVRSIGYHPSMMKIVNRLIKNKPHLLRYKTLFPYSKKLAAKAENIEPVFLQLPEFREFLTFIYDRLIAEIIDGTYKIKDSNKEILNDLISHIVEESWLKLLNLPGSIHFRKEELIRELKQIIDFNSIDS